MINQIFFITGSIYHNFLNSDFAVFLKILSDFLEFVSIQKY